MSAEPALSERPRAEQLAVLRLQLAAAQAARGPALPFGVAQIDDQLADHGLDGAGLHEIAAATASLNDDAAATLFAAGIATRFAAKPGFTVLWALTRFDLYAPGLEQVGLGPDTISMRRAARTPRCWRWPKTRCAMAHLPASSPR